MAKNRRDLKRNNNNTGRGRDDRRERGGKQDRKPAPRREKPVRQDRKDRSFEELPADSNLILGRNPVIEALKNDREIEKIFVGKGAEGSITKILGMAREKGIPIYEADRAALDRVAAGLPHQGVAAYASSYRYAELEDIYARAAEKNEDPFIVVLDNLEDPHNLGAIMRTAECAGAHGVIIPKRRSCGLTDVVAKSSAGAIEYVPVVKVANIAQTLDALKEEGFWTAACDMGGRNYYEQDLTGKLAIVIGSEGFGISRLVKEKCDFTASIPMKGDIDSLNASVAAGVLAYEIVRQRMN